MGLGLGLGEAFVVDSRTQRSTVLEEARAWGEGLFDR